MQKSKPAAHMLMVLPVVTLFLILTIFPFAYMICISFFSYDLASGVPPAFIGFANYLRILEDRIFHISVSFTELFVAIALPVELLLGLAIALFIREVAGERIIRSALLLPAMIPATVASIVWKMLFNSQYGVVNYLLSFIGFPKFSWLGNYFLAPLALIIIDVWQWTPFVFLVFYAGLQTIPVELVETARVDGADTWAIMRHIELPLIRSLIGIVLLLRLIDILKIFDIIFMVTWGGPGASTHSISFYIYKVGISYGWNIAYASALSLTLLVAVIILTTILIKLLRVKEQLGL